jgi:ribosomal protein S18 acetylase RimI-like enzyme
VRAKPEPTAIRFATRADALAVAEMSRDLIETGLGWSWTKERVMRSLRHPDTNAIVAVRAAHRVGFGIMKYGEEEAHLLLLAVDPAHARLGIGREMLEWLERSAKVAGLGRVTWRRAPATSLRTRSTAASAIRQRRCCRAITTGARRACGWSRHSVASAPERPEPRAQALITPPLNRPRSGAP